MAHIVLVEPDRALAGIYQQSLVSHGHRVTPCASAQAAILALDQNPTDIIITELQLIEHSGIEFLNELRSYAEWQKIRVLIHSHVPLSEFRSHWRLMQEAFNVAGYLYKPSTSLAMLSKEVNRVLA